ncbi:MAG: BON domain-containing protein [Acidiferrobacterales bacterium]
MTAKESILREVRAALEHEPRVSMHHNDIRITFCDGALTVEGEVGNIAAKRVALEQARTLNGIANTIDRLRVTPGERKGDGAVRNALADFLLEEKVFTDCSISALSKGNSIILRDPGMHARGKIQIDVQDGVATLSGRVGSLSHKRLAGVLAWWTPGCRDVVNELDVMPLEYDHDDEILDALRLVYEMDPLIHADQIRADSRNSVITLHGLLATEEERRMAELDAWYLFGVRDVVNRIAVGQ